MAKGDPKSVWRLVDANANRAREGLRIIEDTARFIQGRRAAAKGLRELRHRLDRLVRAHYQTLLKHRDVATDSGRKNRALPHQEGVADLLAANFKRCEEALRVLEEYGRVLSPRAVAEFQEIRFEVYAWEKKLMR